MAGTFFTLFEYLRRIGDSFYNFAYIYGSVMRQAADVQSAGTLVEAHAQVNMDAEKYNSVPANWKESVHQQSAFSTYEDEKSTEHIISRRCVD